MIEFEMMEEDGWDRSPCDDQAIMRMWRAVVAQAMRDLVSVDVLAALEVATWLGTDDFVEVCESAFLDPSLVETRVREIMAMTNPLYRKGAMNRLADALVTWQRRSPDDLA